jgi:hypothetical protein
MLPIVLCAACRVRCYCDHYNGDDHTIHNQGENLQGVNHDTQSPTSDHHRQAATTTIIQCVHKVHSEFWQIVARKQIELVTCGLR